MASNPYQVVKDFEAAIRAYTGAPYCVTVNSCTMALLLACKWRNVDLVNLPKHTYISVPMSVLHAGGRVAFKNRKWRGVYRLYPYSILDSARRFTSDMYEQHTTMCVSFHASKILGIEQGGAILHNDKHADAYYRRARFDGRTEGVAASDDIPSEIGYHCYMSPSVAAQGLLKIYSLSKHNDDLPNDNYPDLSKFEIFQ